ncbi:MAG: peptidase M64 [Calditrichales bacterium]|nr:MAG: peptidase M64 [Calditrichales bacterium]
MYKLKDWYFLLFLFPLLIQAQEKIAFDDHFYDITMRIDIDHGGNAKNEYISLSQIYRYGKWAGSRMNLLDQFNLGRYYAKLYDARTGKLIFSKGFDSYFAEYATTEKAGKGIPHLYQETILAPCPKDSAIFALERRDSLNALYQIFSTLIGPAAAEVIKKEFSDPSVKVFQPVNSGDIHDKVDIAFIAEGYSQDEEAKFQEDMKRFTDIFFDFEPYKSQKNDFNIYAVFKPSIESGVDEPRAGIYKQTSVSATFNSLDSERYLLTEDNKALRDIAAHVPYDAVCIMVNAERYGGGGIYNQFCTFTSDNQWSSYLLLHEFGHSFSGLADEYYSSDVAYTDFYPQGVEPVEPNITALLDAPHVKWEGLKTPGVKIPTLWQKDSYDSLNFSWQEIRKQLNDKIAELKRTGASQAEIEAAETDYRNRDRETADKLDLFIMDNPLADTVGAFEGAGYSSRGLYRPMLDCLMFSKGTKNVCHVCNHAIQKVIRYYRE